MHFGLVFVVAGWRAVLAAAAGSLAANCSQDLQTSCLLSSCHKSRGAQCINKKCMCTGNQCAVNGKCGPMPTPTTDLEVFAQGFADGLGFKDARSCLKDSNASAEDMWKAASDYIKGDKLQKMEALVKFGEGLTKLMNALKPCAALLADTSKYKRLVSKLEEPGVFSAHNALTIILNVAEDRNLLAKFIAEWKEGSFHAAGEDLSSVLVDVIAGEMPTSNASAPLKIALGIPIGFSGDIDNDCFKDARVEVPALVGGIMDLVSVVRIPRGLLKVFQGLTGLVPMYKDCMHDRKSIMDLLHEMGDLTAPAKLADTVAYDIKHHGIDIALESAKAYLDFQTQHWEDFGKDIGSILGKVFVNVSAEVMPQKTSIVV